MTSSIKTVKLTSSENLDIIKTFECGQCFRWNADENGVYTGVAGPYPARVWEESNSVYISSSAPIEFWQNYFDLSTDYSSADESFMTVPYLDKCTAYGKGIRILNQDPWEALCSFIISQCNNIKRIKGIVERLCTLCGDEISFEGETYYAFPSAITLSSMTEQDLSCLRSGYRAPYIISAAKAVSSGSLDIEALKLCSCIEAKKELLKLNGIGDKVANCAVLFGLHHMEAFPIDVWIKRALKEHFPPGFDPASLGDFAGLAQQYIFYYIRSTADGEKY